jgi:hypothetical protein
LEFVSNNKIMCYIGIRNRKVNDIEIKYIVGTISVYIVYDYINNNCVGLIEINFLNLFKGILLYYLISI